MPVTTRLDSSVRRMRQLLLLVLATILGSTLVLAAAAPAQAASGYTITGVVTGPDATGRFTIDVGQPGEYTLYANCQSGTACATAYADQYFDKANGNGDAKPVVVSTTTVVTTNMRLPRWATVKGKVTDGAGAPVAGITVATSPLPVTVSTAPRPMPRATPSPRPCPAGCSQRPPGVGEHVDG